MSEQPSLPARVVTVVIGRNEGMRLVRCLASLRRAGTGIIYVDSGSTDNSLVEAEQAGAQVVRLDMSTPFTAARARNAGLAAAESWDTPPELIQFLDGDCELDPDWIPTALRFLQDKPDIAVVVGRLREKAPEASRYNRMADAEWDLPLGELKGCGGIAMMRRAAVEQVGRFNPALIAGEEPELCLRLRRAGHRIWCIDAEMATHDLDMHRFSQWWRRCKRAGFTYAQGMAMYGAAPERLNVDRARRALVWGVALPLGIVGLMFVIGPWALALALLWPVQIMRLHRQGTDMERAVFLTLAKFPEAQGLFSYWRGALLGRRAGLIEYK